MVFRSEISWSKDELDLELLKNEVNYIHECILVNALQIIIQKKYKN